MVKIQVDMQNREKLRRLHTATHIVNFSARQVLGNHIWQNGSNLKPEFGTLDITHYDNLSLGEIFEIENIANKVVFENRSVGVEELERTKAEKKYGYTIYQGGAIPMKTIRIIKVLDSDIEACGGIHMEKTGGIGLIKIVESQKIQDGVVRLKYVVNEFALDYINERQSILNRASDVFSVESSKLPDTCEKFFNEWKEQKKEIEKIKDAIKHNYTNLILTSKKNEFTFEEDLEMSFVLDLFNSAINEKKELSIDSNKFIVASYKFKPKEFKKELKKENFSVYIK